MRFLYLIFLINFFNYTATNHTEQQKTRSLAGENWKIISRGSVTTGLIGYTISQPGNYTLSENIMPPSGNTTAIIQIDSDDVVLDLAGHTLNGTNVTGKGIIINNKKNVTIKNGHLNNIQNINIHSATGSLNIRLEKLTLTNPGTTTDIQIESNTTTLEDIIISGGGSSGTAINCANSTNSLIFKKLRISNVAGKGIAFGTSCYNIKLDGLTIDTCTGTNNALSFGANCYDILIQKYRLTNSSSDALSIGNGCYGIILDEGAITYTTGSGITLGSDTHGIRISNLSITGCTNGIVSTGTQSALIKNCTISKITGTNASSCKLSNSQNIIIENSQFFQTTASSSVATGIWLTTCNNINCVNVQSGGHTGLQAIGFKLDTNCVGCNFNNCSARTDYATSTTPLQGSSGFHITSSKGCTLSDCLSTSHQGQLFSAGYYLNTSSGISFLRCKALQNTIITGHQTAIAAGFYSIAGTSNNFHECNAHGQTAGTLASTAGYGAAGFYFSNEAQSCLYHCKSLGNGATANHAANTYGFYFDAILNSACKFIEIKECSAVSNCTSATSGITAYGFYDTAVATTNIFIDCYAACNSDNASPRVITNYAANLPIGGTTSNNFPRVEAGIDGLLDIANKPLFYNVSITS